MATRRLIGPTSVVRVDAKGEGHRRQATQSPRGAARARAAALAGGADAFVCTWCITLLDKSTSPPSPEVFAQRARRAGVHMADVGPPDVRQVIFGPHKVCALCTGIFVDALTPVRVAFRAADSARRERRLDAGGAKARRRFRRDADPSADVLDKPWMVADGSFEGGKRR